MSIPSTPLTPCAWSIPAAAIDDARLHRDDLRRLHNGELSAAIFKARRVGRGLYEQRQSGSFMARIRLPGGILTAPQARAIARTATQHASGLLHVTDRQDLQIHDIPLDHTPAILEQLIEAGLSTRGGGGNTVRNIVSCPFAGTCPHEAFDVRPSVLGVTSALLAEPGSFNLPRKFKLAFSGCPADCALARFTDLGFVATTRAGRAGFRLYAAGGMGGASRLAEPLSDWIPAPDAARAAEAVRRLFDRWGDRTNRHKARLRYVLERVSFPDFATAFKTEFESLARDPRWSVPEPAMAPATLPQNGEPMARLVESEGLRGIPAPGNRFSAVVHVPLGILNAGDLLILADAAELASASVLWATASQDLILPAVAAPQLKPLAVQLARLSFDGLRDRPLRRFTVCAGAATCRMGMCLSRQAALACERALVNAALTPPVLRELDVRVNGCANACGQHPAGSIGLFGTAIRHNSRIAPAYNVFLGSDRGETTARLGNSIGVVPARQLPAFLLALLQDFATHRQASETLPAYIQRSGAGHFKAMLQPFTPLPAYETQPDFYRDWDQNEDFSLAGRAPGECTAGVFEVISRDLKLADEALGHWSTTADLVKLEEALTATARALLIIRGIDSQTGDAVFTAFERHYLDTGLIADSYRPLLTAARTSTLTATDTPTITRLRQDVEALFRSLNSALEFKTPSP